MARGGLARRAVGGGGEAGVAQPAATALGRQKGLFGLGQVGEHGARLRILDDRAERYAQNAVHAAPTVLVAALATAAVVRLEVGTVAEIDERAEVAVGHQPDVTALAAVAAVRPAPGHEFFPPETDAAVAAVTGFHVNGYFIDEFHGNASRRRTGLRNKNVRILRKTGRSPSGSRQEPHRIQKQKSPVA